ncbi:Sterol O-acyltransferase, putative [Pediculus humanus corporis]|uniref:Sterol O-acyltransferase, putative n=1 Tax=Pediculus humanus subsp. corporis TaxID=121224 RepID=E0VAV4_PEDHC|nr:Sterol O-acyltransferase, putative [Pediculus humanus corporis]EEB10510.1 Sterol O-acyltransferase, putative [Pediculus humanus corporis]
MQIATFLIYFVFKYWANNRKRITKPGYRKMWDLMFFLSITFYNILFLIIPAYVIMHERLAIAISFSLLMEQIRFIMKTYSFVRTNSKIRWKIVMKHFIEIIAVIFYLSFIWENYLIPSVKNFGKIKITTEELLIIFFNNNVPCVFVFLCGFYSFLHSWMNAFAEILRFADRMFYQDWWNSSSFAEYYKTWNVVVHDWLYAFVYKDGTENLTKKKTVSTWMVFIISALFHEYILAFTFKFCYPVLFIVFGIIGTCLVFIPKKRESVIGNMLLWLGIFLGTGCCGSLYMLEYYARINCPQLINSPIKDFFTPRSWTCSHSGTS